MRDKKNEDFVTLQVYKSFIDVINSEEFRIGLKNILKKTKKNKKYYFSLLNNIWKVELKEVEKSELIDLFEHKKTKKLWEEVLWKKKNKWTIKSVVSWWEIYKEMFNKIDIYKVKDEIIEVLEKKKEKTKQPWLEGLKGWKDGLNWWSHVEKSYIEISWLKVMKKNLHVDSTKWKELEAKWYYKWAEYEVKVKVNTKWDIWEYMDGKYKWQQLFTRISAIRESKLQWVRMLNKDEWKIIKKETWWKTNKKMFCGHRENLGFFNLIGHEWFSWLSEEDDKSDDGKAWCIWFGEDGYYNMRFYKSSAWSVRCIVEG